MEQEKIIEKIKKVLELSKNNPSEEEARAAALQAQKLLAKYHIDMAEVEGIDLDKTESIEEIEVTVGGGHKWKYTLSRVVANNFRCRHFYYGKGTVVFYGHQTDAQIAAATFKYLFDLGNRKARTVRAQARRENDGYCDGVFNSYIEGYVQGVKESLEKQCTALVLVIPQDVKDEYEKRSQGFGTIKHTGLTTGYNESCYKARQRGIVDGKDAMASKSLDMK